MYNEKSYLLGSKRSVIRELFEYGKKRAEEIGADKVYDFSLGNPNVPAPDCVNTAIREILDNENSCDVHGYTSAQGDFSVRKTVAENINTRFRTSLSADNIYMTCGAAASLTICLNALFEEGDEFITFAPFFPEYKVFTESAGGRLIAIKPFDDTFQPDLNAFEKSVTFHTKAVILNSPNNPSGVVVTEENIKRICDILGSKSTEYGHPIFIISDEPYREIVYDNANVPFLMNYYDNVLVCYSYSKSLSLPGERIGYIAVNNKAYFSKEIYAAICGAGRALGYVCAPSLMQKVIKKCVGATSDISAYKANRDILLNALSIYGYTCVKPDGAFYLFVKALERDANAFAERAKKYGLLLVPSDDFGVNGFVRISYCVSQDMIKRSLPAFKELAESYKHDCV